MSFQFMTEFKNKIHKLFDKKTDLNDTEVTKATEDCVVNQLAEEFEDCVDFEDNKVNESDFGSGDDSQYFVANEHNHRLTEELSVYETGPKMTNDWYEMQTLDTESRYSSGSPLISVPQRYGFKGGPKPMNKSKEVNRLLEKWGESVGYFDAITGAQTRLIRLKQLQNYFVVKLSSLNSSDWILLSSLISHRYPRFYTSTVNYYQRWRMRYNLFVVSDTLINTGQVSDNPLTSGASVADMSGEQLVLHIGEIHLYFDIVPKYCQPVYVNSSFYANKMPINHMSGIALNDEVMSRIIRIVNSIRYSQDIFQFKFPLQEDLFHFRNIMFDKFFERQMEFIEESVKVFRKSEHKKRKFHNWNQKQPKRQSEPNETRDYFAYDYDIKHKICADNLYDNVGLVPSGSGLGRGGAGVGGAGHPNRGRGKGKAKNKHQQPYWNQPIDGFHNHHQQYQPQRCSTSFNDDY